MFIEYYSLICFSVREQMYKTYCRNFDSVRFNTSSSLFVLSIHLWNWSLEHPLRWLPGATNCSPVVRRIGRNSSRDPSLHSLSLCFSLTNNSVNSHPNCRPRMLAHVTTHTSHLLWESSFLRQSYTTCSVESQTVWCR